MICSEYSFSLYDTMMSWFHSKPPFSQNDIKMKYPKFSKISVRNRTFDTWSNLMEKDLLIQSGFFYIGGRDSVQCFTCGVILHSFQSDDVIDVEHYRLSPNCQYIINKTHSNNLSYVPLSAIAQSVSLLRNDIKDLKQCIDMISMQTSQFDQTTDEVDIPNTIDI